MKNSRISLAAVLIAMLGAGLALGPSFGPGARWPAPCAAGCIAQPEGLGNDPLGIDCPYDRYLTVDAGRDAAPPATVTGAPAEASVDEDRTAADQGPEADGQQAEMPAEGQEKGPVSSDQKQRSDDDDQQRYFLEEEQNSRDADPWADNDDSPSEDQSPAIYDDDDDGENALEEEGPAPDESFDWTDEDQQYVTDDEPMEQEEEEYVSDEADEPAPWSDPNDGFSNEDDSAWDDRGEISDEQQPWVDDEDPTYEDDGTDDEPWELFDDEQSEVEEAWEVDEEEPSVSGVEEEMSDEENDTVESDEEVSDGDRSGTDAADDVADPADPDTWDSAPSEQDNTRDPASTPGTALRRLLERFRGRAESALKVGISALLASQAADRD